MRLHEPLTVIEYRDLAFEVWLAMWLDYIGPANADLPPAVHRYTYQRIHDASTSLQGFVVATDRPIGFVHYYFHPSSYNLTEACTIEDLYVAPTHRGQGVGRWLIERVASIAAAQGAPALHWKTDASNTAAIALYRTLARQAQVLAFRKPL
ncbi:GNAT family N-acetyltransferase [Ideonella sp. 4Y11]|uniref:GNAT family N-acetyltransferase n=1 Tax=Ideonella aquatica TaxID=2824119 RepID=A0A940YJN7_9BURK|nr:GNAT family N-acetyltransferase [Ideonella aquatica]MBQ0958282.1 GNAT family N-acetyltransferase [Ideonella aquatica]